jgi:hypothetical protein
VSDDSPLVLGTITFVLAVWVVFRLGYDWDELAGATRRTFARRRQNRRLNREYRTSRRRHFCRTGKVLL